MNTFGPPKLTLVRGEGAHVWDADGKEYVDLLGGIAVNALGHGHPALVEAVTEPAARRSATSRTSSPPSPRSSSPRSCSHLARRRAERKVFFTNSGAEANEAAFKLTRRTGRTHVVAAEGGFHGRTMGALALTSKAAYRDAVRAAARRGHLRALRRRRRAGRRGRPTRPPRSCSSRSRARPASWSRPRATSPPPAGSPTSTVRCCGSTRCRPAWAGPARWFAHHARRRDARHRHRRQGARPAASRSAPASASARPASCSSPATTAPPSAATRSPARPRSPSSAPSRPRGCSSTSRCSARSCATAWPPTRG